MLQKTSNQLAVVCFALAACLAFLASARLLGLLGKTALLTGGVLAVAMPVGVLLGVAIAKIDWPGRRLLSGLLAAWLFVPLYVQAAAWQAAFGYSGWGNALGLSGAFRSDWFSGMPAAILVHAGAAVPWVAWLIAASLRVVPRQLEEQSLLDARPAHVLGRVSLPHAAGGAVAAMVWIGLVCSTEITVTDLFQVRTFAEEVFTQASLGALDQSLVSDLGLGVGILACLGVGSLLLLAPWATAVANSWLDGDAWRWRPSRQRIAWSLGLGLLGALVLALPVASLIWQAGIATVETEQGFARGWSLSQVLSGVIHSPYEFRREIGWSLAIGCLAAVCATVIAALLGWIVRGRRRVTMLLFCLLAIGMVVPAPLVGVATIRLMDHAPSSWWSPLTSLYRHTVAAPVLVQTLRALPVAILLMSSQLATIPQSLLDAARSDGVGRWGSLLRIALPLRIASLAVTFVVSLAIAIGELSATFLVLPPGVTTLSLQIFRLLHYGADDRVAAICLAILAGFLSIALGGCLLYGKASPKKRPLAIRDPIN